MVNQGSAVLRSIVGMHRKTGALINQQNIFVLVDDVQPGGGHRQIGVILSGLVEEFVIDIQLQNVSGV